MNFSFRISWVQFCSLRNVTKSGAKSQTKEVLVSIHLLSDKTHLHKANVARKISQRYTDTSTYACLMEFHFNLKEIWFYLFEPASPEDKLDFSFSSWVPLFFFRVGRAFMRYISIFRFHSTCSIFSFGQQITMPSKSEGKKSPSRWRWQENAFNWKERTHSHGSWYEYEIMPHLTFSFADEILHEFIRTAPRNKRMCEFHIKERA